MTPTLPLPDAHQGIRALLALLAADPSLALMPEVVALVPGDNECNPYTIRVLRLTHSPLEPEDRDGRPSADPAPWDRPLHVEWLWHWAGKPKWRALGLPEGGFSAALLARLGDALDRR